MKENLCLETLTEFLKLKTSLERAVSPVTAKFGLTPVQAMMLHIIYKNENSTVGSIFKKLNLNQGNVSSVCKRLQCDGFITRKKSSADERQCILTLTDKGLDAVHGIGALLPAVFPPHSLSDDDDFIRAKEGLEILKNAAKNMNKAISKNSIGD